VREHLGEPGQAEHKRALACWHARQIRAIEDELQIGQTLEVMCIGRSPRNTAKVSRRALLGPVAVPGAAPQPRAATAEGEASAPQPRAAAAGGADGS